MLVKNRFGRIVDVPADVAEAMVRKGEAIAYDETPKPKPHIDECPYCFELASKHSVEECKKKAPIISVVIPSRVGEEIISLPFLEGQTYGKIEIIIEYDKKKEGANKMRNNGAKKSKGEFVLFSDNDLEWDKHAFSALYKCLLKHPESSYSYGSYTLDGKVVGNREFSSHDLWRWNYISTMSLIRKEDFQNSGGFDEKLKRFQDWDLWLTLLDAGKEGKYCGEHMFKTKLREGITFGKNATDPTEARKILMEKHSIKDTKLADIIIPHQNRHDMLKNCLDRLSHDQFNIIVVTGGTFAENCNKGAKIAETDNLIFMNDDIEPDSDVIRAMLDSTADVVGAAQITPSWHPEKVWYGIAYKWKNGFIDESITENINDVLIPTGFLMRFKKKVWEELGGFDTSYKNGGEDQEIGLTALEKGYTIDIVKLPTVHHHSSSRDRFKNTSDNRILLNSRWPKERIGALIAKKTKEQLLFLNK